MNTRQAQAYSKLSIRVPVVSMYDGTRIVVGSDDRIVARAMRCPKVFPGMEVIGHGSSCGRYMVVWQDGALVRLTSLQIAALILASAGYSGGPIYLIGCHLDCKHDGVSFADEVSLILDNPDVYATEGGVYAESLEPEEDFVFNGQRSF